MENSSLKRSRDDLRDYASSPVGKAHRPDHHWPRHFPASHDEHLDRSTDRARNSPNPTPSHLQINYLARQHASDLSLLDPNNDALPTCIKLLNQYSACLERSESLANNLGARPLSSILLQRFERMFDGPPQVLGPSYNSEVTSMSWFDVANASPNPTQLTELDDPNTGKRLVQFVAKGVTVQVSMEEWQMVSSGLLQKVMPSQPVAEDEEKELATLEILEDTISRVVALADQVAARGRQFNHRAQARRSAIIERRHADATNSGYPNGNHGISSSSPSTHQELTRLFTASRRHLSHSATPAHAPTTPPTHTFTPTNPPSRPVTNHTPTNSSSTPAQQRPRRPPAPPVPEGPFKPLMTQHMEMLPKGARIEPPCDRCRRLQIDCAKNLTACIGCTKKHCKCSWRDVTEEEADGLGLAHEGALAEARSRSREELMLAKQERERDDVQEGTEEELASRGYARVDQANGNMSPQGYAAAAVSRAPHTETDSSITIAGHDVPIGTPDMHVSVNGGDTRSYV
ncbi:MAG: hypothetical protein Q9162_002808 [Coniocarpon cinnabarinum]